MIAEVASAHLLSPLGLAVVAFAGGAGAVCRFGLDTAVQRKRPGGPLGILLVNLLASLGIGVLAGLGLAGVDVAAAGIDGGAGSAGDGAAGSGGDGEAGSAGDGEAGEPGLLGLGLASGLLGGFSTFSTVAVDTAKLARARRWGWTALNSAGMLALCALGCLAAWALVRAL